MGAFRWSFRRVLRYPRVDVGVFSARAMLGTTLQEQGGLAYHRQPAALRSWLGSS